MISLVSSPDLIWYVYHFQYNAQDTESDPRWGWFWVWDRDYDWSGLQCLDQQGLRIIQIPFSTPLDKQILLFPR